MDSRDDVNEHSGGAACSAELTVERAAIRTDDGAVYSVDRPGRHHNVIAVMREAGYEGPIRGDMQGFVLSNGRFVMRKAALRVALRSGQVGKELSRGLGLLSEDVW